MRINNSIFEEAKHELLLPAQNMNMLKIQCNGKPKTAEQRLSADTFFNKLDFYISKGIDRGDVYNILHYLYEKIEYTKEIYEYETTLIGNCSPDYVFRFPNEPEECLNGSKELYDHIHSLKWKHE